ncbi:MAG: lytic transglycosylase domain-containing protein, partial [Sphingopyxis sp.]|nr:lytic transglycosylase domain-containing protein [Sphingopyxis sp.]
VSSAAKFLTALETNPDQPGASMMPEAAAANRSVFYAPDGSMRSLSEIRERFRVKLEAGGKIENMKPFAPSGWHAQVSSSAGIGGGRPPLQMMDIQPMPQKLSMGFAADAYRRLASLSGGAA